MCNFCSTFVAVNVKNLIFVCCIAGLCMACTPRAVREARDVVAQADSLWHAGQMYGMDAGDSATLAQAYETLGAIPLPFREGLGLGSSYARSCYHYGRLLRAKEDPVAAMQVFIAATHSHTRDYHILGRVYSNMGSICHLAGEYPLSYDMYEKSANMFLLNGDSLLYFYGLNNMAFELAEQGKKEETLNILSSIEEKCYDKNVHIKALESKAKLYLNINKYDSVLWAINHLHSLGNHQPTGYVLQARALWHLGQIDSALYYAQRVVNMPDASDQNRYNMLYILLNGDSTLLPDEIKSLSEKRADLEALILVPKHKKDAIAATILHQDLKKMPESVLICIWSMVILCIIVISWVYAKRIQKAKRQQQEAYKSTKFQQRSMYEKKLKDLEQACSAIRSNNKWKDEINWKDYDLLCEFVDTHFFFFAHKLKELKLLNETETRLCILVLIGYNRPQIAQILPYASNSVGKLKDQTAKLLGTTGKNLRNYLLKIAVER